MSLFGTLFGGGTGGGGVATPSPLGGFALDVRFAALAVKLIDNYIEVPNAVWSSVADNPVLDANSPFVVGKPTISEYAVKILFSQDDLEDRQFRRYRRKSTFVDGQVNGFMLAYAEFEPRLKDTVTVGNTNLLVQAIDPIQPIDQVLIYLLEFGS
jgi:hypothetical protein